MDLRRAAEAVEAAIWPPKTVIIRIDRKGGEITERTCQLEAENTEENFIHRHTRCFRAAHRETRVSFRVNQTVSFAALPKERALPATFATLRPLPRKTQIRKKHIARVRPDSKKGHFFGKRRERRTTPNCFEANPEVHASTKITARAR
jgi:hypothetical protein